ncbi:MAG: mechanosensitive ion channel [Chitinophagales bacterium]|nr:mechanosensitive ion channel [Chitinophagales bacterium]
MDKKFFLENELLELKARLLELIPNIAMKLMSVLVIFIIGYWVISLTRKIVDRILVKEEVDESVRNFTSSIVKWVMRVILFIIIIGKLGIQTSGLVAMLGAAGLAVGLALQGSLSNFAGSILILIFKPFRTGDYIATSVGGEGTVDKIDLFHTRLVTSQNQLVVIPNGSLSNSNITNYSANPTRCTWFNISLAYNSDLKEAKKILLSVADKESLALKTPKPVVMVTELKDNSINISVRVWAKRSDYWTMIENLMINSKIALEEAGISMIITQKALVVNKDEPLKKQ